MLSGGLSSDDPIYDTVLVVSDVLRATPVPRPTPFRPYLGLSGGRSGTDGVIRLLSVGVQNIVMLRISTTYKI